MFSNNNLVVKSNVLNELRQSNTSLVQYRLFCIALSRLNPMLDDLQPVKFSLTEYAKLMNLAQPRAEIIREQAQDIVQCTVTIDEPSEDADAIFVTRSLFDEFKLSNKDGEIFITLEFNKKLKPYLVNFKRNFFKYKLYNTIFLNSYNQIRLYELLKQYQKLGERIMKLDDLRAFLSIGNDEYPLWNDFNYKVIKVAQKALKTNTDIFFEYEPIKKNRRVVAVKFFIKKNDQFVDQLQIDDFLGGYQFENDYDGEEIEVHADDGLDFWREALTPYEFKPEQIDELQMLAREFLLNGADKSPSDAGIDAFDLKIYDYLSKKTRLVRAMEAQGKVKKSVYGLLKRALTEDWQ